jgi:glucose/arabinose dehydrogenase
MIGVRAGGPKGPLRSHGILPLVARRPAFLAAPSLLAATAVLVAGCHGNSASSKPAGPTASPASGRAGAGSAAAHRAGLKRIGTFSSPTYVTAPRGDRSRLFVVEQGGRIRVVLHGRKLARPFLDISRSVLAGGERGLLSMAFAPDYAKSRRFYVYFTGRGGDIHVQEFRRWASNPNRALARSRRNVITIAHHEFPNHNGGQLQFGPDGYLYAGTGDGGSEGDPHHHGQSLRTLLAKLIRIDPRRHGRRAYRIPRGNPFRTRRGARPAIWAYGLRNPWRFSFDRRTGALAIADVGQDRYEEVDFAPGRGRGANYGWNAREGFHRYAGGRARHARRPVLEQSHASGWCSITGGYVVRDRSLPSLYGRYVYGDYCRAGLRSVRLRRGHARGDRPVGVSVPSLVSFGEDGRGRVYAVSQRGGVWRLVAR